jgi:hypothetical protein
MLVTAQDKPAGAYQREVQLDGLSVSIDLVKSFPDGNLVRICWPEEVVTVDSTSVSVAGKTISELLRSNHIFPDVEAFGIVYSLNPDLKRLDRIDGARIRIPIIKGGESLRTLFGDGFQVLLTSDPRLKKEFSVEVAGLGRLTEQLANLETNKFFASDAKPRMISALNNVLSRLRGINTRIVQRASRPIPTEVVEQLLFETQSLNLALTKAVSTEQGIGRIEIPQVNEVAQDLEIKVRALTETASGSVPKRWPEADVIVRTLKQGQEVPDLRIYYVSEASKEKPEKARSFGKLSSPSTRRLPEADYCFWAARDPNKTAISNIQCEQIRVSQGATEIQLTILP